MFGWLRGKGRIDYQTAPVEPPAARLANRDVERLIDNYDQAILWSAEAGDWWAVDQLLDARNAVRPARPAPPVPVIPGRSS